MGRSPSVRRLSDKLHFMYRARLLYLSRSLCISAIKIFGSDQALEPRVFQPGDVSDRPSIPRNCRRTERFHSLRPLYVTFYWGQGLFLSLGLRILGWGAHIWLLTRTSGIPPSLFTSTSTGTQAGRGKETRRDAEDKRLGISFALNLSGSGNPGICHASGCRARDRSH